MYTYDKLSIEWLHKNTGRRYWFNRTLCIVTFNCLTNLLYRNLNYWNCNCIVQKVYIIYEWLLTWEIHNQSRSHNNGLWRRGMYLAPWTATPTNGVCPGNISLLSPTKDNKNNWTFEIYNAMVRLFLSKFSNNVLNWIYSQVLFFVYMTDWQVIHAPFIL